VYGFAAGQRVPANVSHVERFERGPSFVVTNQRINALRTIALNAAALPGLVGSLARTTKLMRSGSFRHAIVDFEPIAVRAARRASLPFTVFDNQTAVFTLRDVPPRLRATVGAMRAFVRAWYGGLSDAAGIMTCSLVPAESSMANQVIIPPCVRSDISDSHPTDEGHLLFYSSVESVPGGLVEFARRNPGVEVRAYAHATHRTNWPPNLTCPGLDSNGFVRDLLTCRLFVTHAGFESVAEAVHLGKPLLAVPISGQWEQAINGWTMARHGLAMVGESFGADVIERAWHAPEPPTASARRWVSGGRGQLETVAARL
jgi:uncharacterized protein (TIGR00661 family)